MFPVEIKFRPEVDSDVARMFANLPSRVADKLVKEVTDKKDKFQPTEYSVMLNNKVEFLWLLSAMIKTEDCHRMIQTMDLSKNYSEDWLSNVSERYERVSELFGDEENVEAWKNTYATYLGLSNPTPSM